MTKLLKTSVFFQKETFSSEYVVVSELLLSFFRLECISFYFMYFCSIYQSLMAHFIYQNSFFLTSKFLLVLDSKVLQCLSYTKCRERIIIVKKFDFVILMNLQVLSLTESEKPFLELCACASGCLCVNTITQNRNELQL